MTGEALVVLLGGHEVGRIVRDRRGRVGFTYRDEWRSCADAFPLSLSLPLAAAEHPADRVEAFLWGLLPDDERILDRWARRFQVSARSVFGLLSHVGEDCAGAAQFVRPERLAAVRIERPPDVVWLKMADIEERLAGLRTDPSSWRAPSDSGQFSLSGAQPKTALFFERGRWGVPAGRTPTTHILKPAHGEYSGHIENEHLCLALARELGLPAAASEVRRFGKEPAIVIERYDRIHTARRQVLRLHQEDLCQALGLPPTAKYQNEGGPGAADVVALLRTHSSRPVEDVDAFTDAFGFAWLTAGTDAHAKNYSLLHAAGGRVRLAPLYDLASALPYGLDQQRLRLAMKVGDKYRLRDIGLGQWRALAVAIRVDPDRLVARVVDLAARLPAALAAVRERAAAAGLDHPLAGRLAALLAARAKRCLRDLGA